MSSRAVLERSRLDCSTATIRNEFILLEQEGYIAKPHTSAGRIPTDRGYRYYVDHLSPGSLLDTTRTRIGSFFASMHAEMERLLKETTDLLSEITHFPAVVLGPGLRGHMIKDARLLAVGADRLEVLLPPSFPAGEAEAVLFMIYKGETVLSNPLPFSIEEIQP